MYVQTAQPRLATVLALIITLIAACAAPTATPDGTTPEPEASEAAVATPEPSASELALPDDLTLEELADSTVTGVARFEQLTEGDLAISVGEMQSEFESPLGYAALILRGTCAEQSEPADFDGAIDVQAFDEGESAMFQVSPDQLLEILSSPNSILVTNGPGDHNLACADIGG